MTEIGLGIFEDKEELVEALELFEKNKKNIQDHILDRTKVVPKQEINEIEEKYRISKELAKTVFVLDFEYQIPRKLTANLYKFELDRLKDMQYELPDIYSFRVRFSIEEGFWIKYLAVDFPKKVQLKIKKLIALDRSIFGDLAGDKEDSASYILERAFICNDIIRPVLLSWMKEHQRANFYTATLYFISGIKQQLKDQSEQLIEDIADRFFSNFDALELILAEIPTQGWILKAKEEFSNVFEKIHKNREKIKNIDWRIAAELILETILLFDYDISSLPNATEDFQPQEPIKIVTKRISAKKEQFITDEISSFLTNYETLTEEQLQDQLHNLVEKLFNEATVIYREKPANFAKNFIERIAQDLYIAPKVIKKYIKDFENQLMHRLSPTGKKEFSYLGVDELVTDLIERIALEILQKKESLEKIERYSKEKQKTKDSIEEEQSELEEKKSKEKNLRERLLEATEKDLWLMIRDEYLKMLFDNPEELVAGAKILKKFSLEFGLLLTEGEASTILTQELEKKGIMIADSNKEEVDANICKIIFKEIKDQRSSQK